MSYITIIRYQNLIFPVVRMLDIKLIDPFIRVSSSGRYVGELTQDEMSLHCQTLDTLGSILYI